MSGFRGDDPSRAVNSPTRRKPKNPRQQAAQRRRDSYDGLEPAHELRRRESIRGVMGRRRSGRGALVRLAPRRTYDRRGNALGVKGSGRPVVIWR